MPLTPQFNVCGDRAAHSVSCAACNNLLALRSHIRSFARSKQWLVRRARGWDEMRQLRGRSLGDGAAATARPLATGHRCQLRPERAAHNTCDSICAQVQACACGHAHYPAGPASQSAWMAMILSFLATPIVWLRCLQVSSTESQYACALPMQVYNALSANCWATLSQSAGGDKHHNVSPVWHAWAGLHDHAAWSRCMVTLHVRMNAASSIPLQAGCNGAQRQPV